MRSFVPVTKKVPIPTPEIVALTPVEQLKRYRQLAADAEQWASTSPAPAHRPYLPMAERWRKLADEIESGLKP
jgi:phytoene/squalene synthetase